jgi:hypothetical protein
VTEKHCRELQYSRVELGINTEVQLVSTADAINVSEHLS